MLAILTTGHITVAEPSALRRGPSALPPSCEAPPSPYVAGVWSPDNASLYLATSDSITRYDASGTLVKSVWPPADSPAPVDAIDSLAVKDKGSLIVSMGSAVHIVEHSSLPSSCAKIAQTLPPHPDAVHPVHALSLSHDSTLLAAASAGAAVVHNLALGVQTPLRGLPGPVAVCTFHAHSRVRLFLGVGPALVVYDITRPSGPSKVAPIGDGAEGDVVAVACSPYSKTLLAVACSSGYVALVDLDKELGRIRSFHFKVGVTSLVFSADGASLYIGTEDGRLLVQTLRSMDEPKTVAVGEEGCRVEGLAITKKSKHSVDAASKTTGSVSNKPLSQHDIHSPRRSSTGKGSAPSALKKSTSEGTVDDGKPPLKSDTPLVRKRVSSTTALGNRKIVSSVRSIFTNAAADDTPAADSTPAAGIKVRVTGRSTTPPLPPPNFTSPASKPAPRPSVRTKPAAQPSSAALSAPVAKARTRTVSSSTRNADVPEVKPVGLTTPRVSPRTRTLSAPKSPSSTSPAAPPPRARAKPAASPAPSTSPRVPISPPTASAASRRPASATSRLTVTANGTARVGARQRATSGVSRTSTTRTRSPPPPPVPSIPQVLDSSTRTPSPELLTPPSPLRDTAPPFPIKQDRPLKKGLSMLGLATPEVERWIAGKAPEKVPAPEFPPDAGSSDDENNADYAEDIEKLERSRIAELSTQRNAKGAPRPRTLSMQITPRKAPAWAASPLRHSMTEGSPGVKGVTGLLHALISDAMLDFRQETRAEMVGLHLDLVRMGRAWRQEMRAGMQEYVGDLRELREENRKLREENERLRRGY
ncbi:WD40-repeat-containing domain protein [Gloeopeniophorella convolvens]|nr:WD40-repeat-containing domain protein [Gloeopeniophorella convolvens]